MHHVAILEKLEYENTSLARKDSVSRATGKFYTPPIIAAYLNAGILSELKKSASKTIKLVDPFAGDGRLAYWLIKHALEGGFRPRWSVDLWDRDRSNLEEAARRLKRFALVAKIDINVSTWVGDSFRRIPREAPQFDVVLTNPPWEALKPDRRELLHLSSDDKLLYVKRLRRLDEWLSLAFPHSQPSKKFAGWGTNLSRVGIEASMRLLRPNGILGLVTPASFFADQVSLELRKWLFTRVRPLSVASFPAEAKLFDKVDHPVVAFTAQRPSKKSFAIQLSTFESRTRTFRHEKYKSNLPALAEAEYRLPLNISNDASAVLMTLNRLPTWGNIENGNTGIWSGRELDETNYRSYLSESGTYKFVKGRMIGRFAVLEEPSSFIREGSVKIPATADQYRLAWRDVSRLNQKRRMHATLIPPGWVTGNSLGVALFKDGDVVRLRALLAIANSMVFEAQIRSKLVTTHVSLGVVRSARIPPLTNKKAVGALDRIARSCLNAGIARQSKSEILVAKAFGLSRDEFACLLPFFPKLEAGEIAALLDRGAWASSFSI